MTTHIYKWERVTARTFLAAVTFFLMITLAGCGDDGYYKKDKDSLGEGSLLT